MGKRFWYGKQIVSGITGFALAFTTLGPMQSVEAAQKEMQNQPAQSAEETERVSRRKLDLRAELDLWIVFVQNLNKEEYTAESWAVLDKALNEAIALAEDENAKQSQMDEAIANLVIAFGGLEYGVQKQHLQAAVDAADEILANEADYEQGSLEHLKELVQQAKQMLGDLAVSQEEVNQMTSDLIDAIVSVGPSQEVLSLKRLLEAVESLDEAKYTSQSWANLEQAVSAAWATLEDPDREEDAIKNAYENLSQAIRDLEMKGNKESLAAVIQKAEEILADASSYVESSLESLREALEDAKAVYENADAGQREVEEAVQKLTEELMEVRLRGDVDGNGRVDTSDFTLLLGYQVESRELDEIQLSSGDINGDGKVDTKDSVLMLRYISEKIDKF